MQMRRGQGEQLGIWLLALTMAGWGFLSLPTRAQTSSRAQAIFTELHHELEATETKLRTHPYVAAVQRGDIPRDKLHHIVAEEYHIVSSDLRSIGELLSRFGHTASGPFFAGAYQGEQAALAALKKLAATLGMSEADLQDYEPMAGAHAYTAYMAWLAHYGEDAQVAAAFAVNFPAWGANCGKLSAALQDKYGLSAEDVTFFSNFAKPIPGFQEAAAAIVDAGLARGVSERDIKRAVRLLQDYELMFWDTLYAASR
jgi:thiaminase